MKVFISSLITGMEPLRAAARQAVMQLDHDPAMAEDFGASPNSPQVTCLQGLRDSAIVVLILGPGYGAKQASGLSATHEEYREAKDRCPIIAFVQEGVTHDADQAEFVREVRAWDTGLFRDGFRDPEELKSKITRRLHQWEVATASGPIDGREMLERALGLIPEEPRGYHRSGRSLVLAIAPGPKQAILRPSEIEKVSFHEELLQHALFGDKKLFSASKPTIADIEDHALSINHDNDAGAIRLDGEGNLTLRLPLRLGDHGMVVIEENVAEVLLAAISYAVWVLDRIDQTQRLTHFALAATLPGSDMIAWQSQREEKARANSYNMGFGNSERRPVHLAPAHRPRPALKHQADRLVEDVVTLLRREWKGR